MSPLMCSGQAKQACGCAPQEALTGNSTGSQSASARTGRNPTPAGDQTDTKSFDSNTLQRKICLRLRVIWIQPGWPESSNDKASPGPVMKPWKPLNFQKWFWFLAQLWHCYSHGNCVNSGQWCPAPLHLTVTRNKGKWYFSFFQETLKK